ncbi:SHOCT domain-containing protein [Nocardioides sp.]|uniref:SHOCT domain-containing protein n=1 Tax=Nocardioides sp. TaxID=35761 RepID=UPI003D0D944A
MDSFWDFFWLMISTFLFFGYLVVLFQIIIDLFRDHSVSGLAKALWVFGLLILPLLTALAYLITRGGGMAHRQMASMQAAQRDTEAYIQSVAGGGSSPSEEIAKAKALLDSGTISASEYDALKAKALG